MGYIGCYVLVLLGATCRKTMARTAQATGGAGQGSNCPQGSWKASGGQPVAGPKAERVTIALCVGVIAKHMARVDGRLKWRKSREYGDD
jgi:hypothetical protein